MLIIIMVIIIIIMVIIIIIHFVITIGNKRMKTFWNDSSLSTQKHAYWRLYYNPELYKLNSDNNVTCFGNFITMEG